jgi:hypothetical protein
VRVAPGVLGPRGLVGSAGFYRPFYAPYYAFRPRFGLGFGFWAGYPVAYPYYYGYGYPYYYGYGYPYAYPPYPAPYAYPPYGYAAPAPGYDYPTTANRSSRSPEQSGAGSLGVQPGQPAASGGVSFEVTPSTAAVYIDGTYVGTADNFGPRSQPLGLTAGRHHIEIRAPGYRSMAFDTDVTAGQVIPYQGTLQSN